MRQLILVKLAIHIYLRFDSPVLLHLVLQLTQLLRCQSLFVFVPRVLVQLFLTLEYFQFTGGILAEVMRDILMRG